MVHVEKSGGVCIVLRYMGNPGVKRVYHELPQGCTFIHAAWDEKDQRRTDGRRVLNGAQK